MMERRQSPEQAEAHKFNAKKALERFKNSLEEQGKRIMCILGPAIALGASPAFAEGREQKVEAAPDSEMHCDIVCLDAEGKKVGEASLTIPDLENIPLEEDVKEAIVEVPLESTGILTEDTMAFVTTTEKPDKKPSQETDGEERSTKTFKETIKIIQKQAFTDAVAGGQGLGWTFDIDTSKSERWSEHNVRLTTALVIPKGYGLNEIKAKQLPEAGAFVKLTIRPK